ncbi:GPI-anchored wall transfer protein 1-like [Hyposmocoma kahamanoa]|uniref:GPI-anchored wall transfer protein 1-like n=1 Tax=Hyposmocoma kahamanoa TaxID=1477025 RepID=UPI000E6D7E35|nr:GPI-anchored wall transfer protein 1-like [Hyposmocoma kahamanoa]
MYNVSRNSDECQRVHKDLQKHKTLVIIKSNAKFFTILILLGIARFISVKQLDYQEHVTEYGVHWNFFFTLALCKLLATCILFLSNRPFLFSLIILVFHELILYFGLQDWVFSDTPRTSLITANREGITSCLGYVSLYLYAAYVKTELSDHTKSKINIVLKLACLSVIQWMALYFLNNDLPVSRTLANSSYCIYLSSVFTSIICLMYFIEVLFQDKDKKLLFQVPLIILAINDNGLIYFLTANLLTGAVNLSCRTLFVSSSFSIVILNVYMVLTLFLVVYLKKVGLKI